MSTQKHSEPSMMPSIAANTREKHAPHHQSIHLDEAQLPASSRLSILSITLILSGFLIWASVTPIEEVAMTEGSIIPTALIKSVQHLEGGIVKDVLVSEGELVRAGQSLILLDGKAAASELQTLMVREKTLKIRAERLRAYGLSYEPNFETYRKELPQVVDDQEAIYKIQVKNRDDQLAVVAKQLEQRKAQLAIQLGQEHDYREQLAVVVKERDVQKDLLDKKLSTGTKVREAEEKIAEVKKDLNSAVNQAQSIRQEMAEKENELLRIATQLRNDAMKELGEVTVELSQVTEAKDKLVDRVERLEIVAPNEGVIKGLKANTLKGIIKPGDTILEIVPVNAIEAEVKIKPKDVGNLRVGQKVTVKVTSFDYARYGSVPGSLTSISASTFVDEAPSSPGPNEPYYKGRIKLEKYYVGQDSTKNVIMPGMIVQADIDIGAKSLMSYLTNSVYKAIESSFGER